MNDDDRHKLALWRLSVLGPLISARLRHGDRRAYFELAAGRIHERPDGALVRLSPRTIENWYRTYQRHGFAGLMPNHRVDSGKSRSLAPEIVDLVLRAKRERPRRSIRRIIKMLERAGRVEPGTLSRSTVHRVLHAAGISSQPKREGAAVERRSFLPEHAGDLWLADAMHGPRVVHEGRLVKSYLLTQLDGATRFALHSTFYLSEGAVAHEHGLREAFMRHGLPRTYYVDRGSAFIADSLRTICAELGVHLLHTKVRDAEAKGAIERFHRTWREEVGDELPATPLSLADLNAKHWAWLHADYHERRHSTTGRKPREHLLSEDRHIRSVPLNVNLDEVFMHRDRRTVRKDGTIRWRGGFVEVAAEVRGKVELRYDPADLSKLPLVYVEGRHVCDTVALDLHRNNGRRRRKIEPPPEPPLEPTGIDVLADIERDYYERVRIDATTEQERD
ncbi:MAG: helix-turn-helix domain-containing protein [Phycisphaerales bacterium]